jgi:DNA end-binding protein Ku
MAPRSFWKGYLKLSLVTCPVTMEAARTPGETLRFHTVNRETGNRVESRYVDSETGKPVAEEDQAKGYEIEDDRFVILEDEELEAVGSRARGQSTSSGSCRGKMSAGSGWTGRTC